MGAARPDRRADDRHGCAAEPVPQAHGAVGAEDCRPGTRSRAGRDPRRQPLMLTSFNAIVPMACVTAAAVAAMTAEAFRAPGERMPIAPLGVIGLIGAGVASFL